MPQCKQCGSALNAGDLFCGECGRPVPREPQAPPPCPKCQTPFGPDDEFCGECGFRRGGHPPDAGLSQRPGPPELPPVSEPRSMQPQPVQRRPPQEPTVSRPSAPASDPQPRPTGVPIQAPTFGSIHAKRQVNRASLWIVLGLLGVALLAIAGNFGYKIWNRHLFENRIDAALAQNRIFSPPGNCVADFLAAERVRAPNSRSLAIAATKVRAKLEPMAAADLHRWYKDSDPTIDWKGLEQNYALLQRLFPNDNEIGAHSDYVHAQAALMMHNYEQARQLYNEALGKKPNWVLALNGLGKLYIQRNCPFRDEAKATAYYQSAILADPDFTWSYVNLAYYYWGKQNLDLARQYLEKALQTYPNNSALLRSMGDVCFGLKDYSDALSYYQKALPLEPDASKQGKIREIIARTMTALQEGGPSPASGSWNVGSSSPSTGSFAIQPIPQSDLSPDAGYFFWPANIAADQPNATVAAWTDNAAPTLLFMVNGKVAHLPLASSQDSRVTPGAVSVGDREERVFSDGSLTVDLDYRTTFVCPKLDESCEVTKYAGTLKVSGQYGNAEMQIAGVSGD